MKFKKTTDDKTYLFERRISENGLIEIGVYPVMFGYRVRAGFAGSQSYELDYCGGADQKMVELLYSATLTMLSQKEENYNAFDDILACSKIKPYFNDAEFTAWLLERAGKDIKPIQLRPLTEMKEAMFKELNMK
jgi:hypothetical protein